MFNVLRFIVAIAIVFSSQQVLALSKKEASDFFENYIKLGEKFDVSVKNLYSDDAKIHAYRRYPHGLERAMEMTGKQWKTLLEKSMPIGKKRGDISKHKNVTYTISGSKITIKADRYSVLKCYTDTGYYMVVQKNKQNLQIIEEYFETQPQSDCIQAANGNLAKLLRHTENQIKGHLPLMVDEDTRLDSVKILNNKFYYIYTLINVTSGEFNANSLSKVLRPVVLEQTCTMPNLKPLVQAGGIIAYTYKDNSGKDIVTINIEEDDCK